MGNVLGKSTASLKPQRLSEKCNLAELAEEEKWEEVKLRVKEGDNVNQKGGTAMAPALWYAALYWKEEMCQWLVAKGADPKAKDEVGSQPIHAAAAYEEDNWTKSDQKPDKVFDILLSCGVSTEEVDTNGKTPLHYANTVLACQSLVARGANIYAEDCQGLAAIHTSVLNDKEEVFSYILGLLSINKTFLVNKAIEIISQCDPSRGRAVMAADIINCKAADPVLRANMPVSLLLKLAKCCNDDIAQAVLFEYLAGTPGLQEVLDAVLLKEADAGTPERIRYLVSIGGYVKCCDVDGDSPLHVAVGSSEEGRLSVVKALIDCGASVAEKNAEGRQPVHAAVWQCVDEDTEVVQLLIKSGASVSEADDKGDQPIHIALKMNSESSFSVCLLLLENGASATAADCRGNEPLHLAVQCVGTSRRFQDFYQLFIDRGASVAAKNKEGNQALHLAARLRSTTAALCSFLVEEGGGVTSENKKGNHPLHEAARFGSAENCAILIAKGANVNAENLKGDRPIHKGAKSGSMEVCHVLVSHGANVKAANRNGDQPLHKAAQMKNATICQFLIEKGANPDAKNGLDDHPLHFLCKEKRGFGRGRYEFSMSCFPSFSAYMTAECLLTMGADASAKNKEGDQPLHYLAENTNRLSDLTFSVYLLKLELILKRLIALEVIL